MTAIRCRGASSKPCLFENVPAADRCADDVSLDEVERCDLYVGLCGYDYGVRDGERRSPTPRQFDST